MMTPPNRSEHSDKDFSPSEMSIRAATEADAHVIADLLLQLGNPSQPSEISERLETLAPTPTDFVYVAEQTSQVQGLLVLHLLPLLHRPRALGRISVLVVDQSVRGQGIGRCLVEYAIQVCRDQRCGAVEVTSNVRRTEAHAFYRSLGFQQPSEYFVQTLE